MKLKKLLILVTVLLTCSAAFAEPDPNFYIFLCFGQSNMESGGSMNDEDKKVDERLQVMADFDNARRGWKKDQWYHAVPPLTAKGRGICMIDGFGKTMVNNLPEHVRVGIIKVSVPGCKIELFDKDNFKAYLATERDWMQGLVDAYNGSPYQYMVDMAKVAQKDGVIKGFLLHQGESNSNDEQWPSKVKKVYDDLIKDLNLNAEEVALLSGELVNSDQGGACGGFNKIMAELPKTLPNSYVISSAGCPTNDRMHFNSEGSRMFGKRYAEQMLSILGYGNADQSAEQAVLPNAAWNCGLAEGIAAPEQGELVFEAEMPLGQVYDMGQTQYGDRVVLVTEEGTVKGDKLQGTVMAGGLDFELTLSNGVMEIEQVLVLKTTDGQYIYARNAGVGVNEKDVRVVMDFEAPVSSPCEWLNSGKYVATRTVDVPAKKLKMSVYDVSKVTVNTDNAVQITKPDSVPAQSWEYRVAASTEKQGEQILKELVTLGSSVFVGNTKRGRRNIIPITGGDLEGMITGKVLFGGADYQNLGNPATIDARYLWQTGDGEVIIVRNAGSFGMLVPTFETKVDGKYAWLNSGNYLSSPPGMGAGGVSLTMYKSK